jgi:hypothetical protein
MMCLPCQGTQQVIRAESARRLASQQIWSITWMVRACATLRSAVVVL